MKTVLVGLACFIFCGMAIYSCVKYPMESGLYLFSKEGRTQHAVQVARMKTAQEGVNHYLYGSEDLNKIGNEEEYQRWKEQEDEYRWQRQKETRFRKRYEREGN